MTFLLPPRDCVCSTRGEGARCKPRDVWKLHRDVWESRDTKHQTRNTKHETRNTKHQTPNTKHQTQNTKHGRITQTLIRTPATNKNLTRHFD